MGALERGTAVSTPGRGGRQANQGLKPGVKGSKHFVLQLVFTGHKCTKRCPFLPLQYQHRPTRLQGLHLPQPVWSKEEWKREDGAAHSTFGLDFTSLLIKEWVCGTLQPEAAVPLHQHAAWLQRTSTAQLLSCRQSSVTWSALLHPQLHTLHTTKPPSTFPEYPVDIPQGQDEASPKPLHSRKR